MLPIPLYHCSTEMTCKPQFLFCLKYWSGNPFTDSFEIIRGSSKNEFVHSCFKKEQARYTYEWVSTYHSWFYFGLMLIITWRPRKARWSCLDIVIWCFGQMGQYQVLSPSPTYLPFSSPFKKSFNYFVGKERPTSNNHHCYLHPLLDNTCPFLAMRHQMKRHWGEFIESQHM